MISKKIVPFYYGCLFFLALSSLIMQVYAEKEVAFTLNRQISGGVYGENVVRVCTSGKDFWHETHTPDGQIFLSVNGHKIWRNKDVDPFGNEPTALVDFSAGNVKRWNITYMAENLFPTITLEGTLWGIFAPDIAKKPQEKWLYKFINVDGVFCWQKDKTLPLPATMVSAARDGSVVAITSDGPYQKVGDGPWQNIGSMKGLKAIASANKDLVYVLTSKNAIFAWKNGTWQLIQPITPKTDYTFIATSPTGTLFCTDKKGNAFYLSDVLEWNLLPKIYNAKQIAIGDDTYYCWTSQPYGSAVMKNHVIFPGIPASASGMAILGSGKTSAADIGTGIKVTNATIASPLAAIARRNALVKLKKDATQTAKFAGKTAFSTVGAVGGAVSTSLTLAPTLLPVVTAVGGAAFTAVEAVTVASGGAVPLMAVGVALPVFFIAPGLSVLLFGAMSAMGAIIIDILLRPSCNEIYECPNIMKKLKPTETTEQILVKTQ